MATGEFCAIHQRHPVMRGEDQPTWEKRLRTEARRAKNEAAKRASDAIAAANKLKQRR